MKKIALYILIIVITLSIMFTTCQHVDTLAQAAADAQLIDRDSANMISLSARAFSSAAEKATPEQEYYIGRAVAANILSTYNIWDEDPQLTAYLNLICAAIVINSPQPTIFNGYYVAILDSDEINAFATSGGHIFLTRGLMNVAETEDDLAAVIAHEVAHIQLRHSIKSIRTSRMTQAILLTATAGIGTFIGVDVNELVDILNESVGEIMQTLVNSGYSREQEYQADVAAMHLLAIAGYQPSSLVNMLNKLNAVSVSSSGLGRTHPKPIQRLYFAEKVLDRFDVMDNVISRQDRFNEMLNRNMAAR